MWEKCDRSIKDWRVWWGLRATISAIYLLRAGSYTCIVLEEIGQGFYSYYNGPHYETLEEAQRAELLEKARLARETLEGTEKAVSELLQAAIR